MTWRFPKLMNKSFVRLPAPRVNMREAEDGVLYLESPLKLPRVRQSLPHLFDETADRFPERVFIRDRNTPDGDWRAITYGETQRASKGLAQWLIDRGIGFGDNVAFLSGPSIEHAIAAVGIQRSGAAIAPISVAYSLLSNDFGKLKDCMRFSSVRLAIVDDGAAYAKAIDALSPLGIEFVCARNGSGRTVFADVIATLPTSEVADRMSRIRPETTARIMYTSGSTGAPKAVPQPQINLTLTVAQNEAVNLHDFGGEAPVILDSMPFSHIMAGNFNFNNVIRAGGTINLDDGKPTPQLFAKTIANLREISPHFLITVPLAYEMLCTAMEKDSKLRDSVFRNLRFLGFGGAVLQNSVKERLQVLSRAARGAEVPILSFYGATEFLFGTLKYWSGGPTDVIGLPLPGSQLKLRPEAQGNRYSLWIKSPALMPRSGYLGAPDAATGLFDDEGFYDTGDAVRFSDPAKPEAGLVFAGRLADDFKLATGTFVLVKSLREDLLAHLAPLIGEAVFCGANENWIGALLWPRDPADAASPDFRRTVTERLGTFNLAQAGSSRRVGTALIMGQPLSFDANELTDKGSVSSKAVRAHRSEDVARLFQDVLDEDVLDLRKLNG